MAMPVKSFVYVIEAENGRIKIGVGVNPHNRATVVHSHSPVRCRLVATWPGQMAEEQELHRRFADFCDHAEWFRVTGPVAQFLDSVRGRGCEIEPWGGPRWNDPKRLARAAAARKRWDDQSWRDATVARIQRAGDEARGLAQPLLEPQSRRIAS
jgi:hypothetical protein